MKELLRTVVDSWVKSNVSWVQNKFIDLVQIYHIFAQNYSNTHVKQYSGGTIKNIIYKILNT